MNKNSMLNSNKLNNVTKSIDKCINNDILSGIYIVVLIAYAILVAPTMSYSSALLFDNFAIRLIIMAIIVGLCFFDPIKALLLAIAFVISIQRLYKLKKKNVRTNNVSLNNEYTPTATKANFQNDRS